MIQRDQRCASPANPPSTASLAERGWSSRSASSRRRCRGDQGRGDLSKPVVAPRRDAVEQHRASPRPVVGRRVPVSAAPAPAPPSSPADVLLAAAWLLVRVGKEVSISAHADSSRSSPSASSRRRSRRAASFLPVTKQSPQYEIICARACWKHSALCVCVRALYV